MNRLTQSDLLSPADYEAQRTTLRQEIIALKKRRRIEVGPLVTLVFENRRTLLFSNSGDDSRRTHFRAVENPGGA